jgi:hypothetical protein
MNNFKNYFANELIRWVFLSHLKQSQSGHALSDIKHSASARVLRGNFFQCHVFAMKSVQNLKYFWGSSQNYFVLALFSSL